MSQKMGNKTKQKNKQNQQERRKMRFYGIRKKNSYNLLTYKTMLTTPRFDCNNSFHDFALQ